MLSDHQIATRARRQYGLLTLADITEAGGTRATASYRVRVGRWVRLRRGVYAIAGQPLGWEANLLADVLAGPEGTVASHRSAAQLWALNGSRRGRPEVSVPRHRRPTGLAGVVHESTDMDLAAPTVRQGIPVTGIHRTLLDVSIRVPPERFEQMADDALRRFLVQWPDLYETLVRHSRRGRDGCGTFRALLDRRYGDRVVPDSVFERKVINLLADAGLAPPTLQHRVAGVAAHDIRLDLAWPEALVGVELQSKKYHLNSVSFDADKARLNRLRNLGWDMYEYTWRHYCDAADEIVEQLATALARRSVSDSA